MADDTKTATVTPIKLEKIPINFQLGDNVLDGAVIRPMTFKNFVDYIVEANAMREPQTFEARLRRVRLTKQITYYINGTVYPVAALDVIKLSISDARKLLDRIDDNEGSAGKIVRDGNGIDKSVVYELGTPIPTGQGKVPITELEFQASTYGDIEDVMAAPDGVQQTMKLIELIAKPVGTSLQLLPEWARNQISVTDGILISRDILPRFLGSPGE